MKLNHTIWILLLALLAGVPSWAQDVVCSADPYGVYSVDTEENNGQGSTNAMYDWTVIPVGAVITPNQGPNGSSNVISVDWSLVAPGSYTLEVVETDTITGCIGDPVSIEVVIEEPLQPQVTCLALSISEVSFSWDALTGANFYELEVLVNGAPFGFENNFIGTEYIVSGLDPGDEVTLNVMPFGDPESCFELGTQVCNSENCPPFSTTETVTICYSLLPYQWNNQEYTQEGTYDVVLQDANGCDYTATLELVVLQVADPVLECWETASLDDATCQWVISGEQPQEPVAVNCWDNYQFDAVNCVWNNIGVEPQEPVAVNCWDDYQFDAVNCVWNNIGIEPQEPVAVNCWDNYQFDAVNCVWNNIGVEPQEPVAVNCWDNYQFDAVNCVWNNIGVEPQEPVAVNCWDNYQFDAVNCVWNNIGIEPQEPVAVN